MMKDSGLRIRVQRDLRDRFLEVCRTQDKPAAQVIREFMRDYVEHHGPSVEPADRPSPSTAADQEGDA
jgi:Ribonuclease G/E